MIPEPIPVWIVRSDSGETAVAVPVEHAHDLGDIRVALRRELRAVADQVTPDEGLTEIREAVQGPGRPWTARIAGAIRRVKGLIAP